MNNYPKKIATILVTGANGQLGNELQVLSKQFSSYRFLFVTRNELPIDNFKAVKNYFENEQIDFCINCAAYTAVDKAESEIEQAFSINADAVGNLAHICKEHHARLIHISSDYVFDGNATSPYKEDEGVGPVSVYGKSKLKGEALAFNNNASSIIIRTSWVYSSFGSNFVKTMKRLMKEKESINVVSDQYGCPTYAADLASVIMKIVESESAPAGIYNYSNEGVITWYLFACAIKKIIKSKCAVNPIPTEQYPTPAKRPYYSVLDTSKIKNTFRISIPKWKDSLEKCMELPG